MKFLIDLFTESDGQSFDLIATLGALALVVAIGLQCYVSFKSGTFDIVQYSIGMGALLVSVGGGQKLKPKALNEQQ